MATDLDDNHHYVGPKADLDPGDRAIVEVEGREIAVFNVNGEFYAIGNHCPHMGGPTCEGRLSGMMTANDEGEMVYERENEIVACPWHGWEFDVTDGQHLAGTKKRLLTYDVHEIDGDLFVSV